MPDTDSNVATSIEASNQVASPAEATFSPLPLTQSGGLKSYPTSQALDEIEGSGVRGNAAMTMLKALVKILESQLHTSEDRLAALSRRFDGLLAAHQTKCERVEVLECELRNAGRLKVLQNVLLTTGGLANGVAVKNLLEDKGGIYWLILIIGTIFLFAGWLWPSGPKPKR